MDAELIFKIANSIALVAWILLLLAPRWKFTTHVVLSGAICLFLSCLYLILLLWTIRGGLDYQSFNSLSGLTSLFDSEFGVLTGWVHFLTFDLFVGMWIAADSTKKKIPHLIIVLPLLLTFMAGPVGLLSYFLVRALFFKRLESKNF